MLIYFAGPDVFWPNYTDTREKLRRLAHSKGIYPLFPGESFMEGGREIVDFNLVLLRKSDGVIANLNPFRGQEPDSGTVFECGYAVAQGKWVIGYLRDHRDLVTKLREWEGGPGQDSALCRDGSLVEDFKKPVNLMLAYAIHSLYKSPDEAINAAAALKNQPIDPDIWR